MKNIKGMKRYINTVLIQFEHFFIRYAKNYLIKCTEISSGGVLKGVSAVAQANAGLAAPG